MPRFVISLIIVATLLVIGPSCGDTAPRQNGGPATSCDSLCQLMGSLARGQWKQLVAPGTCGGGASNFSCHSLGYECGDPSRNGACWCGDFDGMPTMGGVACSAQSVASSGTKWANFWYGGFPNDHPLGNALAYSAPGIRKSDGMVMLRGGGHAVAYSGEGSIHEFNVEAAAANILSGGRGGNWFVVIPGGRLIANSYGEPMWSQQNDSTCSNTSPWVTMNKDNQPINVPGHTYWGITPIPGTTKWVLGAVYWGCGSRGGATSNYGGILIDDTAHTVALLGSKAKGSPAFPGGPYDDLDGKVYNSDVLNYDSNHIYAYIISPASSYRRQGFRSSCSNTGNPAYGRQLIFPDPSSPSADRDYLGFYLYGYNGKAGSSTVFLREHMHTKPVDQCSTFLYGVSRYGVGANYGSVAYDDDDGTFYWFDEVNGSLYHMIINFNNLGASVVKEVPTKPTGDVPACANPNGGAFSSIEYIPASRPNSGGRAGIIVSCDGLVWARSAPF